MKFLILAGGSGTRLWPLSTAKKPKQFQTFLGNRTLLQMAYDRLSFCNPGNIYISTNQTYRRIVKEQLPELADKNIIAEPARRDTGPGIAYAMKYIASTSSDLNEVVTIINADQLITYNDEFENVVKAAQKIASEDEKFVLVAVKTKSPNPNLGYIKVDSLIKRIDNIQVYQLDKFVEKPNKQLAKTFHNSYKFLWNTAIFTWQIKTFFEKLETHAKELADNLLQVNDFNNSQTIYNNFPKISLDYALIEKIPVGDVLVIATDLGWSDIGTWKTLYEELDKDDNDNVIQGHFKIHNVQHCLLVNKTSSEAILYNLNNKVVIKTAEQLLVGDLNDSATLKSLVNKLGN
jgi:mannose-1-phosphate guanylyltransferase